MYRKDVKYEGTGRAQSASGEEDSKYRKDVKYRGTG